MTKRPAFQFYPVDWLHDPALRMCSPAARGLWMDLLCLMHSGDPYGTLTINGRPIPPEKLAKFVGETANFLKKTLNELIANGVCSVDEDGTIFSRRMVRDEKVRNARAAGGLLGAEHGVKGAAHGSKGGRPSKEKAGISADEMGGKKPPLKPPPSSSSSYISDLSGLRSSDDKSSGAEAPLDLDKRAWDDGVKLLTGAGHKPGPARAMFGKLVKTAGSPRALLPAISQAQVNGTQDPASYLAKAAQRIGGAASAQSDLDHARAQMEALL